MNTRRFDTLRNSWFGVLGCVVVVLLLETVFAARCEAQAPLSPALSPWLSLFNNNRGGVLDNYHAFVLPQQRAIQEFNTQRQQLQQQGSQIQMQGMRQRELLGELDKTLDAPRKTQSLGGANPAGYQQYLHYYQGLPARGVPYYNNTRRY